ncbi:lipocalin/fatty-acid binding family protein [Actinomadura kijaniata]|uniref:lipocalin/fatty-acid binding family protein n=1 Tax=Actinomadura kijaniata TaxID=46161 RepID=UPI003F1CF13A
MASIVGKYALLSDPQDPVWDQFLRAAGVSQADREAGAMVRPSVEFSGAGDTWSMKTESDLARVETSFALGAQITMQIALNTEAVSVFTMDNEQKLVQVFTTTNGTKGQVVYEFHADGLTATHTLGGVTAVRKYKRVG